jgi:hypothetical protein
MEHSEVTIHIDKTTHKSPNPTTGSAIYALGKVLAGFDLFEEVHGKGDDILIRNDETTIQITPGSHFYTAKQSLNPGNGK